MESSCSIFIIQLVMLLLYSACIIHNNWTCGVCLRLYRLMMLSLLVIILLFPVLQIQPLRFVNHSPFFFWGGGGPVCYLWLLYFTDMVIFHNTHDTPDMEQFVWWSMYKDSPSTLRLCYLSCCSRKKCNFFFNFFLDLKCMNERFLSVCPT